VVLLLSGFVLLRLLVAEIKLPFDFDFLYYFLRFIPDGQCCDLVDETGFVFVEQFVLLFEFARAYDYLDFGIGTAL
jgi:hypothetical protein